MMARAKWLYRYSSEKTSRKSIVAFCLISAFCYLGIAPNLQAQQSPEKEMSDTVEALCPILAANQGSLNDAERDVFLRCREVKIQPGQTFEDLTAEQDNALGNMTSTQTSSMKTTSVEISRPAANAITARLASLRAGSVGGLALNLKNRQAQPVMLAALDSDMAGDEALIRRFRESGRFGIFVNGLYTTGDKDSTTNEPGFDFDVYGVLLGADYRLTDQLIMGLAVNYQKTEADLDDNAGDTDVDGYGVSLYGTFYYDQFYINGIGTLGRADYEITRNVNYTVNEFGTSGQTTVNQEFEGEPDADEYGFSIGTGYNFFRKGFNFGPYGRLNYYKIEIDDYSEKNTSPNQEAGFGLALNVDDQNLKSLSTNLGGRIDYAFTTGIGIFMPYARFDWQHEFENDTSAIRGSFINGGQGTLPGAAAANNIIIPLDDPDRDFFNLSVGIASLFPHGISAFIDYLTVLGLSDITLHQLVGGVRFEF